ncbi:MAG: hypothetical protein BWK76_18005 [Desulfobulbaceae bacterium A2]|nr:MAG: hypothetical protein BWK76_18005 [Desulfobulbaceae bacterium A2]
MSENIAPPDETTLDPGPEEVAEDEARLLLYRLRLRPIGGEMVAASRLPDLRRGEVVLLHSDHGPEPAEVLGFAPGGEAIERRADAPVVLRRAGADEVLRFQRLPEQEAEAFRHCQERIRTLELGMLLVRVERHFNGGKIIFYFTAEQRVDFRELLKDLVREHRTRIEMRQIGVRHETQMLGGLGPCGQELCCARFLKRFESISIKMAKEQDLPLNPAKISGLCNRLLCCLTYEYSTYKSLKQGLPRVGRSVRFEGKTCRVARLLPFEGRILVIDEEGQELLLDKGLWEECAPPGSRQQAIEESSQEETP